MNLADISIRSKLLVMGLATAAATLILAGVVLLVSSFLAIRADVLRSIIAQATIVADNTNAAASFGDEADARQTLRSLQTLPSVDAACVFTPSRGLLASYEAPSRGLQ